MNILFLKIYFQKNIYDISVKEHVDTLDRKTEAVSNFVFPGLSQNKKEIIGLYGREGLGVIKNQLKIYNELIAKREAYEEYLEKQKEKKRRKNKKNKKEQFVEYEESESESDDEDAITEIQFSCVIIDDFANDLRILTFKDN